MATGIATRKNEYKSCFHFSLGFILGKFSHNFHLFSSNCDIYKRDFSKMVKDEWKKSTLSFTNGSSITFINSSSSFIIKQSLQWLTIHQSHPLIPSVLSNQTCLAFSFKLKSAENFSISKSVKIATCRSDYLCLPPSWVIQVVKCLIETVHHSHERASFKRWSINQLNSPGEPLKHLTLRNKINSGCEKNSPKP